MPIVLGGFLIWCFIDVYDGYLKDVVAGTILALWRLDRGAWAVDGHDRPPLTTDGLRLALCRLRNPRFISRASDG